jgi:hypothetical protein
VEYLSRRSAGCASRRTTLNSLAWVATVSFPVLASQPPQVRLKSVDLIVATARSSPNPSVAVSTPQGLSRGAIGGITGGVLGAALLICLAIILCLIRRQKNAIQGSPITEPSESDQIGDNGDITSRATAGGRLRYPASEVKVPIE